MSAPGSTSTAPILRPRRGRRARGPQRRGLPGDRRRGRVRGPLRLRADLHRRAARSGRSPLSGRAVIVPLRRLPPGFPYSVFLGHGGAQFNLPQMYWRDIGTSVGRVYRHTYTVNRIYRRPIRPLGQTDNGATASEIACFADYPSRYRARGLSWWDFAWTSADGLWPALSGPYTTVPRTPAAGRSACCATAPRATWSCGCKSSCKSAIPAANNRHLRAPDARQPPALPGPSRHPDDRPDRTADMAGAAASPASRVRWAADARAARARGERSPRAPESARSHARLRASQAERNRRRSHAKAPIRGLGQSPARSRARPLRWHRGEAP